MKAIEKYDPVHANILLAEENTLEDVNWFNSYIVFIHVT